MRAPRHPIVLAHGLAGFSQIAVRQLRLATYFRGVPEYLEERGCRVIQAEVPPLGSVEARAKVLREQIREAANGEMVHVIAHSMGGLDARYMISNLGMDEDVMTLVTLGAPHRGSPVADRGLAFAAKTRLLEYLKRSNLDVRAFHDLRPEACERRNEKTPDAPGVRYLSIAGAKRRDQMIFALRFTHDVIAETEGTNDGLVSVKSAAWGEVLPRWDCDHVNLVGWTGPRTKALGFARDVRPRFARLARRLAEIEAQ